MTPRPRRRRGPVDLEAREALANAKHGCRCRRCWGAAEFFLAELGDHYGLAPAPGQHEPLEQDERERDQYYAYRAAQLMLAEQRNQEDDAAERRGLKRLTHADLHPADRGLRARQYR